MNTSWFLLISSTTLATIQGDSIISTIGVIAGIALGVLGIYQRIEENHSKLLSERLEKEEKSHDRTRESLQKYKNKFGVIKDESF